MLLSRINLRSELIKEQSRQEILLDQVYSFLNTDAANDAGIIQRLSNPGKELSVSREIKIENPDRIFSYQSIKNISIRYRLRFLESSFYNAGYPYDAIAEIKAFEKKYETTIHSFFIMAPSEAFELENINKDPLLFVRLNNNNFYLIHHWGNDLAWYRKILTWPLQNLKTLLITLFAICLLFAFSLPSSVMNILNFESEMYLRIWLSIHTFIGLLGLTLWAGLSYNKSFSAMNWDSKYYNY